MSLQPERKPERNWMRKSRRVVRLALPAVLLVFGSLLLSLLLALQVKLVPPARCLLTVGAAVARYNLFVLPLIFLANASLGMSFVLAHQTVRNLPLLVAAQTFVYYLGLIFYAWFGLGDRVAPVRALLGLGLILMGVYVLKG
jgi:hypothetical protein